MTLMPGLIDAHVHVTAFTADPGRLAEWSPAYVMARAAHVLVGMLRREEAQGKRSSLEFFTANPGPELLKAARHAFAEHK